MMKANCVICGKEFEGKRSQKNCSPECRKVSVVNSHRKYRETHRDALRERGRRFIRDNPDKIREWNRKAAQSHPERAREASRKFREKHPERWRERARRFREEHREEIRKNKRELCKIFRAAKLLGIPPLAYAAMKIVDKLARLPAGQDMDMIARDPETFVFSYKGYSAIVTPGTEVVGVTRRVVFRGKSADSYGGIAFSAETLEWARSLFEYCVDRREWTVPALIGAIEDERGRLREIVDGKWRFVSLTEGRTENP